MIKNRSKLQYNMINFEPQTHTYKNNNGEVYESVSQVLSKYKKPFDTDFFSRMVAKKRGVSQDVVKEEWKQNTENACSYGKDVHTVVENYLKNGTIDEQNIINEFQKVFPYKRIDVRSEIILWNDTHKIAGTSDIIIDVDDKFFDVLDIKTNKKFDFYNKYNETLLKPLEHLHNCKYSTYGIQLSLYAYMYAAMTGKKPRKLAVLYWNKVAFEIYHMPYMFWDVSVLLKHYSKQPAINN